MQLSFFRRGNARALKRTLDDSSLAAEAALFAFACSKFCALKRVLDHCLLGDRVSPSCFASLDHHRISGADSGYFFVIVLSTPYLASQGVLSLCPVLPRRAPQPKVTPYFERSH
jgi:hypothetical protein